MLDPTFAALKSYIPPEGWKGHLFLLPEQVMRDIHQFILDNKLESCIELGTGFGATTCVMADAITQLPNGKVTTIDQWFHQPVNVDVIRQHVGLPKESIEIIADRQGYNWYLADLLEKCLKNNQPLPQFDFCLLDGAHEWEPDALAFYLIARFIKPGGWIVIDDLDFKLRMISNWQESHPNHSDRELDTYQMQRVFDLVVTQHPDFQDFKITHNGRMGWARKKISTTTTWLNKLFKLR